MANHIREIRERLGMSRPQLAAHLGVVPSVISRWEGESRLPSLGNALALADALGVRVEDLGFESAGRHRQELGLGVGPEQEQ